MEPPHVCVLLLSGLSWFGFHGPGPLVSLVGVELAGARLAQTHEAMTGLVGWREAR
jgi:hypothetical protein